MALNAESAEPATSDKEGPVSPSRCRWIDAARRSLIGRDRGTNDTEAEESFKDVALNDSSAYTTPRVAAPESPHTSSSSGISTWKRVFMTAVTIEVT